MFEINVQFEMYHGVISISASPPQITYCDAVHSTSFAFQNSTVSVRNDLVYSFSDLAVANVSFYTILPCFMYRVWPPLRPDMGNVALYKFTLHYEMSRLRTVSQKVVRK